MTIKFPAGNQLVSRTYNNVKTIDNCIHHLELCPVNVLYGEWEIALIAHDKNSCKEVAVIKLTAEGEPQLNL